MSVNIKLFLFILGIVAFVGGFMEVFTVLFAALAAIIAILFAYFWSERAFDRLHLERVMNPSRVKFGGVVDYKVAIENRKFLPVPWLELEDRVTEGLDFVKRDVLRSPVGHRDNLFLDLFGLKWFERVRRRYRVVPHKRGLFQFGPAELRYKGILGFFKSSKEFQDSLSLIVYPRVLSFSGQGVEPRFLFGSRPRRGWIYTDPLNPMGVRPYQNTDSVKQINWKCSVRHQQLESDIYHPSYDPEVHVLLAAGQGKQWWKQEVQNDFELAVISVASITQQAFENGCGVGFYTNAKSERERGPQIMTPNRRFQQEVLTRLALLRPFGVVPVSQLMWDLKQKIRPGATVIVISNTEREEMRPVLSDYARRYTLTVIWVGQKERQQPLSGANYLYLKEDKKWDEIQSLKFTQ